MTYKAVVIRGDYLGLNTLIWHVILVYIFRYFLRPLFSSSTRINAVYSLIQYFKFQQGHYSVSIFGSKGIEVCGREVEGS